MVEMEEVTGRRRIWRTVLEIECIELHDHFDSHDTPEPRMNIWIIGYS